MNRGANNSYLGNIKEAISSLFQGLRLSLFHIWEARESRKPIGIGEENYFDQKDGIVTLQYPNESLPVPDNARYRLHNEIEDCIVCDKCAKICPVNCIEIEPIRAIEEDLGKTSDGTPKRIHAARFDIDMGKCCFCGLCTTVCPTECLTMTKAYDFSEFDVADHIYAFAEMTPLEILEKQQKLEVFNAAKAKRTAQPPSSEGTSAKPAFKPRVVPKPQSSAGDKVEEGKVEKQEAKASSTGAKPVFRPKVKPVLKKEGAQGEEKAENPERPEAKAPSTGVRPVFRPKVKPVLKKEGGEGEEKAENPERPEAKVPSTGARPVFRPKVKPVLKKEGAEGEGKAENPERPEAKAPSTGVRPVFRPKVKPVLKKEGVEGEEKAENSERSEAKASSKAKPVFRPKIKPKKNDD